jgi:Ca2+:H+ antiporter
MDSLSQRRIVDADSQSSRPSTGPRRSDTLAVEAGTAGEDAENMPPPPPKKRTIVSQLRSVLFKWMNILLVFAPVGIATHYAGVNP